MKTPRESLSRPQSPPQPQKPTFQSISPSQDASFKSELKVTASSAASGLQLDDLLLSPAKRKVLKKIRRHRLVWISVELLVCVVLLALLVLHSFRLNKNKGDNTYAQWSSSWVMVLLSVLLVIFGFAVFITFYYYRTVLAWIKGPATSDEDVVDPQKRHAHGVGWRLLRLRSQGSRGQQLPNLQSHSLSSPPPILPTYSSYHRHRALQHQYQQSQHLENPRMQRPWLAARDRNSRAWRQMRHHEQQHQQQQHKHKQHRGKHHREPSTASSIGSGDAQPSPRKARYSSNCRPPPSDA